MWSPSKSICPFIKSSFDGRFECRRSFNRINIAGKRVPKKRSSNRKAHSPKVFVQVLETSKMFFYHRSFLVIFGWSSSDRYLGAMPGWALKVKGRSLKLTHSLAERQCSLLITNKMSQEPCESVGICAAIRNCVCKWFTWYSGIPYEHDFPHSILEIISAWTSF